MVQGDYVVRTKHGQIRVIPCRAHDHDGIRYCKADDEILGTIETVGGESTMVRVGVPSCARPLYWTSTPLSVLRGEADIIDGEVVRRTLFGLPVKVDPTMPPNEIELRSGEDVVRIVDLG